MPNKREVSISLAKLASTEHRGLKSEEPMSELNPDAMDKERKPDSIGDKRSKKSQPARWWSRLEF